MLLVRLIINHIATFSSSGVILIIVLTGWVKIMKLNHTRLNMCDLFWTYFWVHTHTHTHMHSQISSGQQINIIIKVESEIEKNGRNVPRSVVHASQHITNWQGKAIFVHKYICYGTYSYSFYLSESFLLAPAINFTGPLFHFITCSISLISRTLITLLFTLPCTHCLFVLLLVLKFVLSPWGVRNHNPTSSFTCNNNNICLHFHYHHRYNMAFNLTSIFKQMLNCLHCIIPFHPFRPFKIDDSVEELLHQASS